MTTVQRLISTFIPNHYDLSLTLNREERTFRGTATIKGVSLHADGFSLHAKDLTIDTLTIDGKAAEWSHGEHDELILRQDKLQAGKHIVVIGFSGKITDAMHGLYPCYYEYEGKKQELLATQFESHHAREVFPCVDEPEAKAAFDLTLTTETSVTVLGNQPIDWQREENGKLVTSFQTTPRMSTYLLAFITGNLQKKTAHTKNGTEVNVYATPAQSAQALDFPLDIAVRSIEFYNQYFGIDYPLPKSDHVALPDFSSGAMENWGLVTYREIALLADPKTTSISSRQYIATVIAHELAHQWFGNLVTMKWWNNLWLNESFATLMEYIAVDALEPDWNIWTEFASSESVIAMRRDATKGVQSVQVEVHHPDEISTIFDGAIVYAKGARLLRMLREYIGDESFQVGLNAYFKAHAYANTEGDDLWKALSDASGKDVANIMNTWISQPGYPVVHVTRDGQDITLRQKQFFVGEKDDEKRLWPIPLNSTCSEMPELLAEESVTVTRHHTSTLLLNVGGVSHFVAHYSDDMLADLLRDIEAGKLDEVDRLNILNDYVMLARGGVISSAELLPILKAYAHESSEPVWNIISMTLAELRKFVENDKEAESALRTLSGEIARAQYDRLGWNKIEGESDEDSKLRANVIALTIYSEDEAAIKTAQEVYRDTELNAIDPELRAIVIGSNVRHGDKVLAEELLDVYKTSTSAELQQDISSGLTSTKTDDVITLLLDALKDKQTIRPQDAFRWFAYLIRNKYAKATTWQWLQNNWQWVEDTFAGDKSYDSFPRYAAMGLSTREQLEEYKAFFTPKRDITALTRIIDLGITEIAARVELIERDGPSVRSALLKK